MLGLLDWIFVSIFGVFCALDFVVHPRSFPQMPFWRLRGMAFFVVYFLMSGFAPLLWDGLLGQYALLNASALPLWVQFIGGFFIVELGIYAHHRTAHNVDFLWRHSHQTHHSAERMDAYSAFIFHPIDIVSLAFAGSLALVWVFGVSAPAAIAVNLFAFFLTVFQHANMKTPRWLGYIIVRPESHALHHQRGVHAYNYCDFPPIDMMFGTFKNPRTWDGEAGFFEGASSRIWSLFIGKKLA